MSRWVPVALAGGSILMTVLAWRVMPFRSTAQANSDYIGFYEPVARNVLAGRGLVRHDGYPAVRYPPGFPIALAGIYGAAEWLDVSEAALLKMMAAGSMAMSTVLLYLLSAGVWGLRRA